MAEADFGMRESFNIDNGELKGLRAQEIFVLGVEWQMIAQQADHPKPFRRPIHMANKSRIEAILRRRNREFKITIMAEDKSEDWLWLSVE